MLQTLSEELQLCYRQAEQCARRAQMASNEVLRADYLLCEQRWMALARSYEQQQRLTLFINESSKRKTMNIERRRTTDADGPAAGAAWVRMPWSSKAGHAAPRLQDQLITTVDDDQYARAGLRDLIESLGHPAAAFESAEEYLVSDIRDSTACLILDVHLPGMSGPDLQAHLIAGGWCPPIVFVTGRFEQQVQKRVTAAGAIGYLTKPCDEKTLFDCIDKALGATR